MGRGEGVGSLLTKARRFELNWLAGPFAERVSDRVDPSDEVTGMMRVRKGNKGMCQRDLGANRCVTPSRVPI